MDIETIWTRVRFPTPPLNKGGFVKIEFSGGTKQERETFAKLITTYLAALGAKVDFSDLDDVNQPFYEAQQILKKAAVEIKISMRDPK